MSERRQCSIRYEYIILKNIMYMHYCTMQAIGSRVARGGVFLVILGMVF